MNGRSNWMDMPKCLMIAIFILLTELECIKLQVISVVSFVEMIYKVTQLIYCVT